MRKPKPPVPRSLKKRENILNRAELIARLNAIGEGRRAQILQRNAINEHDKLTHTYARDSPAYAASFEHGHRMRENEARIAQQIRAAMARPREVSTPSVASFSSMPPGITPHRGTTPAAAPMTPAFMLPPLGVPQSPTVMPTPMGPPRPMSRSGFRFTS